MFFFLYDTNKLDSVIFRNVDLGEIKVLHYQLDCSCFISFLSVRTSLPMSHLISFTPYFIFHVSSFHLYFLHSTVHLIRFICDSSSHSYLAYLVALILLGHSTLLPVLLFSQSRVSELPLPSAFR